MAPTMDVRDAYVGACSCLERIVEIPYGTNGGPPVERILAATGNAKGDPWCCAACMDVGRRLFGAQWPLPMTGSCNEVAVFALRHGIFRATKVVRDDLRKNGLWYPSIDHRPARLLVPKNDLSILATRLEEPFERGDICLLYDLSTHHFHHAGVVKVWIDPFPTWEGNTIKPGNTGDQREGYGYFGKTHPADGPWGSVRWASLIQEI